MPNACTTPSARTAVGDQVGGPPHRLPLARGHPADRLGHHGQVVLGTHRHASSVVRCGPASRTAKSTAARWRINLPSRCRPVRCVPLRWPPGPRPTRSKSSSSSRTSCHHTHSRPPSAVRTAAPNRSRGGPGLPVFGQVQRGVRRRGPRRAAARRRRGRRAGPAGSPRRACRPRGVPGHDLLGGRPERGERHVRDASLRSAPGQVRTVSANAPMKRLGVTAGSKPGISARITGHQSAGTGGLRHSAGSLFSGVWVGTTIVPSGPSTSRRASTTRLRAAADETQRTSAGVHQQRRAGAYAEHAQLRGERRAGARPAASVVTVASRRPALRPFRRLRARIASASAAGRLVRDPVRSRRAAARSGSPR